LKGTLIAPYLLSQQSINADHVMAEEAKKERMEKCEKRIQKKAHIVFNAMWA